jgi:NADH:ubiquinone oxidoreductase subunit 6 (subunit J)
MQPNDLAFILCSAVTLVAGFGVVTQRRMVAAALLMLPCFAGIAGLYLTLAAEFVFAIQILIYAGAIMVLIVFVIFMLQRALGMGILQESQHVIIATLICLVVLGLLGYVAVMTDWQQGTAPPVSGEVADAVGRADTNTGRIGALFLTRHLFAFELASIVLTVAMIGAIIIARRWPHEPEELSG